MQEQSDRRIPNSVFMPHAEEVTLVLSAALGQPMPQARVLLPYPEYCYSQEEPLTEQQEQTNETSESMKQGESFMKVC